MEEEKLLADPSKASQCKASLNAVGDALYANGGKWKFFKILIVKYQQSLCTYRVHQLGGIS